MADINYVHICDYAFPGEGNKPCIVGIFEVVQGPEIPLQHPLMFIAISVKGSPHEQFKFAIEITLPDGKPFARIDAEAGLGEAGMQFIPMRLQNVTFPQIGVYVFSVQAGGREMARTSLHVQQQSGPTPARPS